MRPKVYARKKVTHDSRQNSNFQQPPLVSPSETVSPSAPLHCHPAFLLSPDYYRRGQAFPQVPR